MKTTRHATHNLDYQLVWLAGYHNSVLVDEVADRVKTILHEIADDKGPNVPDRTVHSDHIHLFVSSPPKHALPRLANLFKGISSRKYHHRYADHDGERIGWVRGYCAAMGGHVSSETVTNYVQRHEDGES